MKIYYVIALAALALPFALSGCATTPNKTTAEKPAAKSSVAGAPDDADAGEFESHRKTVVSRAQEFSACYQPALKRDPKLRGEITLTWDVNAAGDVIKEGTIDTTTTIHDKLMIECMLDRVHNWKFDTSPKDSLQTVVYPFYFSPPL